MGAQKIKSFTFDSSAARKRGAGESLPRRTTLHPVALRAAKISKGGWQTERENLLLRLCRHMDARVKRGQPVAKAARKFSRKWNGRFYKSDSSRKIQMSASSLAAHYSRWQVKEDPETFRLHYQGPTVKKIPSAFLNEVARRATASSAYSFQSVLRDMQADLLRGKRIPGCKTDRKNPAAPLPFKRTVYRCFAGINLAERRALHVAIARAIARLTEIDRAIAHKANAVCGKDKEL